MKYHPHKYLPRNIYISLLALCVLALGLFLVLTNPADVNIALLVVPVVLLFLIAFCISYLIMGGVGLLADQARKKRTVAVVSASLITVIMILQSTGGISGIDVLLLGLIVLIAGLYISKF